MAAHWAIKPAPFQKTDSSRQNRGWCAPYTSPSRGQGAELTRMKKQPGFSRKKKAAPQGSPDRPRQEKKAQEQAPARPRKEKRTEKPAAIRQEPPKGDGRREDSRRRSRGRRNGPPEMMFRRDSQKDSTEQPSLMKPYYMTPND